MPGGIEDILPKSPKRNSDTVLGSPTQTDISSYLPYLKGGVNSDFDINFKRAQNQPWYEQAGKAVGNAALNTVTGILQAPGYLAEMFDGKNDYTNGWVEFFDKLHNPLGEIYKEHPDKQIDLTDSGWYFDWVQSLAEGAAALGTFTYGMGAGSAKLAGLLGDVLSLEKAGTGIKALKGAAQLGTAMSSAYVEGAMSGKQIYQEIYTKQYQKALMNGYDPSTADKIASDKAGKGAAATVRTNTVVNTLLNLGEVAAIFHEPEAAAKKFLLGEGAKLEGESNKEWAKRLRAMSIENPEVKALFSPRKGINSYAAEMLKEGIEEVNTQVSEHQGRRIGNDEERNNDFTETMGNWISNYAGDSLNQEGLLNFVSGAIMGPAQALLIDHIPLRYTHYDENGNRQVDTQDGKVVLDKNGNERYKTYRVNSKVYNERGVKAVFENYRDALADHIDTVDKLNVQLKEAQAVKNELKAEQIRNELFAVNAFQGIELGTADHWKKQYETIAQMDNVKDLANEMQPKIDALNEQIAQAQQAGEDTTELEKKLQSLTTQQQKIVGKTEAMMAGYATGVDDNEYKKRALEYAGDIDHLKKLHANIQRKFNDEETPHAAEVANHIFYKQANLYLANKALQKEEARIAQTEALESFNNIEDIAKVEPEVNAFNAKNKAIRDDLKTTDEIEDLLKNESSPMKREHRLAQVVQKLNELVKRYGTNVNIDEKSNPEEDLDKVRKQLHSIAAENHKAVEDSIGYTAWSNEHPDKSVDDYLSKVAGKAAVSAERQQLEIFKQEHKAQTEALNKLLSNPRELFKQFRERHEKMVEEIKKELKQKDAQQYYIDRQKKAVAQMKAEQREKALQDAIQELNSKKERLSELNTRIAEIQQKLNGVKGVWANKTKFISLYRELSAAKKEAESLRNEIRLLETQVEILKSKADAAQQKSNEAQQTNPQPTIKEEAKEDPTISQQEIEEDEWSQLEKDLAEETETDEDVDDINSSMFEYEEAGNGQDIPLNEDGIPDIPEPTRDYFSMVDRLSPIQQKKVKEVESKMEQMSKEELIAKPTAFLQELTDLGMQRLQPLMRNAVLDKKAAVETQVEEPSAPEPIAAEQNSIEIIDETEDVPEVGGVAPSPAEINAKISDVDNISKGAKSLSFDKVAFNNVINERQEAIDEPGSYSTTSVVTVANGINTVRINPKTNTDTLRREHFKVGDAISVSIDEDFDDMLNTYQRIDPETKNFVQEKRKFSDWIGSNGKIIDEESITLPIKITDNKTGKTIGYIHAETFLTAKDNSGNYINHNLTEDELEVELANNKAVRQYIIDRWNRGIKTPLQTSITNVTAGHLTFAGKSESGKFKYQTFKAADMIFEDITFGVAEKTAGGNISFLDSYNHETTLPLHELSDSQKSSMANMIVAYIPLTNSNHMPVPMSTPQLSSADVHALTTAIEWHLQLKNNIDNPIAKKGRENILKATGYDIRKSNELAMFVREQYTWPVRFNDEDLMTLKENRKMLHIGTDGKRFKVDEIKVGVTLGKPVKAKLVNGQLSEDFKSALESVVKDKFKSINLAGKNNAGLNSKSKFTQVEITGNGQVRTKDFATYNDYAKSLLETALYGGTNIDKQGNISYTPGNGQYIYNVNSQIHFDVSDLLPTFTERDLETKPADNPSQIGTTEIDNEENESADKAAEDVNSWLFGNENEDFSSANVGPVKITNYTVDGGNMELNLENLEKLSNLASSIGNRNNLTVEEILNKYQQLGITSINPDIHNPFEKC